jgi:hypothetical protein
VAPIRPISAASFLPLRSGGVARLRKTPSSLCNKTYFRVSKKPFSYVFLLCSKLAMDYNHIPLYPYDLDPYRILSPRRIRQELPAAPPATPPEPPPPPDPPPSETVEDRVDAGWPHPPGGGSDIPDAAYWENPPAPRDHVADPTNPGGDQAAPASEPDSPEAENTRLMRAWLDEHWDIVEAMARAGEAPRRPPPPPPPEPPGPPPPVHVRRGDRWNKWKMAEFLRQLAATHSVTAAARSVGMSRPSAYRLRNRLKGQPFDVAWEAAFRQGFDNLAHAALELALEGEEVPHYYQGELKGTHRKRHPNLMLGLLRMTNRMGAPMLGRYGAAAEYYSERWDLMLERVGTGPVRWDDEYDALPQEERAKLPDERRTVDLIVARNLPDEPKGRFGR